MSAISRHPLYETLHFISAHTYVCTKDVQPVRLISHLSSRASHTYYEYVFELRLVEACAALL